MDVRHGPLLCLLNLNFLQLLLLISQFTSRDRLAVPHQFQPCISVFILTD
jgi:hypothetical protein